VVIRKFVIDRHDWLDRLARLAQKKEGCCSKCLVIFDQMHTKPKRYPGAFRLVCENATDTNPNRQRVLMR